MNEKHICAICGNEYDESNMTCINGDWVCDDCRDDNYAFCDRCGEWYPVEETVSINHGEEYWCVDCADNWAYQCEDCGDYFTEGRIECTSPVLCYGCLTSGRWETCSECGDVVSEDESAILTGSPRQSYEKVSLDVAVTSVST